MWTQYKFKEGWVGSFFAKFFYNLSFILMGFLLLLFFMFFANTMSRIITKSHGTSFPIILHVLIYVLCMCSQSCDTSYEPKFGGRGNNKCAPVCVLHTHL